MVSDTETLNCCSIYLCAIKLHCTVLFSVVHPTAYLCRSPADFQRIYSQIGACLQESNLKLLKYITKEPFNYCLDINNYMMRLTSAIKTTRAYDPTTMLKLSRSGFAHIWLGALLRTHGLDPKPCGQSHMRRRQPPCFSSLRAAFCAFTNFDSLGQLACQ